MDDDDIDPEDREEEGYDSENDEGYGELQLSTNLCNINAGFSRPGVVCHACVRFPSSQSTFN